MRAARMSLCLAFLGLVLACEPDAAGPEMDAAAPAPDLLSPAMAERNGATVFKGDIGCRLVDGAGNWFPEDGWTLPCTTEINTNSANLNALVVVRASGVPNPTGRTVHWGPYNPGQAWADGYPELSPGPYPCMLAGPGHDLENFLFTINWRATVSASGEAMLVCHYSKKWEFQWPG